MSNKELLREQVLEAVEEANLSASTNRHVTPGAALTVVERSFSAHQNVPFEVQEFHAMRELSAFIVLMQANKVSDTYANHTDLLPVSHPASTRIHAMTASGLIKARLRWTLADSRISEEAGPLLAAAFLAEPNSVEYVYAVTRLNALPAGSYPLEALIAAFGDGNSSIAKSMRAMLQRRDRRGRFAYQGGGGSVVVMRFARDEKNRWIYPLKGTPERLTGRPVSMSQDGNTVRMELPDGRLVDVPTDRMEFIKAVINPTESGYSGVAAKYNTGDPIISEKDLGNFDAPHGFEKDTVYSGPGTQYTDDSYNVVKKDDGSFLISRRGMGEDLGTADSWSEVQKMIQDDDENLAKAEGSEPIARLTPEQIERMYDDNFDPNEIETPGGGSGDGGGGSGDGGSGDEPPAGGGDFEYQYPEGAYQLSTNVQHMPGTNPLNDSEDYTDDPAELAQVFPGAGGARLIGAALQQALLPQGNSNVATGFGELPFEFDEPVPAEALYLALEELGADAKKHTARVYDTLLEGSPNLDAYTASKETSAPKAVIPTETDELDSTKEPLDTITEAQPEPEKFGEPNAERASRLNARADELAAAGKPARAAVYRLRGRRDGEGVRLYSSAGEGNVSLPVGDVETVNSFTPSTEASALMQDGGITPLTMHELAKSSANAAIFHQAINDAKNANEFGASVFVYSPEEYADMRMFLSPDGKSGFALKGTDLVSVFKGDTQDKRVAHAMVPLAIEEGAITADAFDTTLPEIYGDHGLKTVARLPWDDSQAPSDWDKDTFSESNNGEPDVVFMAYDPEDTAGYTAGQGEMFSDYDDAVRAQQPALDAPSDDSLPDIGGGWTPTQETNSGRNLPAYRKQIDGVTYEFSKESDGKWYLSEVRGEDYYLPRGEDRMSPTADAESFENLARLSEDVKQKQQRDAILRILGRNADQELIDIIDSGTADEVREAILNSEFYANLSEDAIKYLRDGDRSFLPDANNLRALESALEKIKDNYPPVEAPTEVSYPESGGAFSKDQLDSFVKDIQSMLDSKGLSGTAEVLSFNPSAKQYEISSKVRVNIAGNDERLTITSYSDGFTVMRTDVEDGNGILLNERPDDTPTVEEVLSEVGKTLDGYKNEGEKIPTPTDEPNIEEISEEISSANLTDDEIKAMLDGESIGDTDEVEGEAPAEVRSSRATLTEKIVEDALLGDDIPSIEEYLRDARLARLFFEGSTLEGARRPELIESSDELGDALSEVDLMENQEGIDEPEIFAPGTPVNGAVVLEGGTIIPAESVTAPNGTEYNVSVNLLPRYDGQPEVYDVSVRDPRNPGTQINSATAATLSEAQALHADMLDGLRSGTTTVNTDVNFGREVNDVQPGDSSPYVTSNLLPNSPAERMRVIGDKAFRRWQELNNIYGDGVNQARIGDRVVHSYDGWNSRGEGTIVDWTPIQNSGDRRRESYAIVAFQDGSYAIWSTRMLFLNGRREGLEGRSDYTPPTEVPTAPELDPNRARQVALTNKYTVEKRGYGLRETKIVPYVSEDQGVMVGETRRALQMWEERKARVDEYRRANGLPVEDTRLTRFAPPTTGLARIVWLRATGVDTTGMQVEQPTPRRRRVTTTPVAPLYNESQLSPEVYESIVERLEDYTKTLTAGNTSLIVGEEGIVIFDNIGNSQVGLILPDGSLDWYSNTSKARHGRDVLDALRGADIIPAGSIPPPPAPTSGPTEEERAARREAEAEAARIAQEERAARNAENQAWLDTNKQVVSDAIAASNLEGFDPASVTTELGFGEPTIRMRYQPDGFQNRYSMSLVKKQDGSISAIVIYDDPNDSESLVDSEDGGVHSTVEEAIAGGLEALKKATEKSGELSGEELKQYLENEARRRSLPTNERSVAERFIDRPISEVTPTTGGTFDGNIKGVEAPEPDRIDPNAVKGQNGELPTQADFEALGWEPQKAAEIARAAASRPSMDYIISLARNMGSTPAERAATRQAIDAAFSTGMGKNTKIGDFTIGSATTSIDITPEGNGYISTSTAIINSNGRTVASADRVFYFTDGKFISVYNAHLKLPKGTSGSSGFSNLFNQNTENWYIANGGEYITILAAGGSGYNGGYVWAITGFNWLNSTTGVSYLSGILRSGILKENEKASLERLQQRAFDAFGVDNMNDLETAARTATEIPAGFPTPREFAMIGWTPQLALKDKKWFGQKYMSNNGWQGKKNLKPTAIERVQNYTYEDMKKSRNAAARGENSFKTTTWLGSIFTDSKTYEGSGSVIAPYADELSDLVTGRGDRSVSLLSPPARVALASYISDMLISGNYLIEGNTAAVRNKNAVNTKSLVDISGALQTDRLGREPNKTALSIKGQELKATPASTFADITDPNTPKVLDNGLVITRLPYESEVTDGTSGAVGGASPAWKVVDPKTGETFYVKDTTNVGSAQSEVAVNVLARSMNLLGIPVVDLLEDNPNFMVTSELGTNMSLSPIDPSEINVDSPAGYVPNLDTPYMLRAGESGLFGDAAKNANQMAMNNLIGIALLDAIAQNEDRHAGNIMMVRNTRADGATTPSESWIPVPFDHADSIAVDHANGNTSTGELLSPAEFLRTSMGDSVEWAASLLEQMGPIAFKMMMDRRIQETIQNLKANYDGYVSQAVFNSFMSRLEETSGYTAEEWVSIMGSSRG